jgi:adenosine deaminase
MDIGVDRLDHGTNIVESPALVAHVVEKKIGLTCCPISNSFVTPTMKAPEMVELMGKNVLVTINSDDPAYMLGEYCAENYVAIANKAGLSPMEMVGLAKNSFKASWASDEEKKGWVDEVDRFVDGWKD